MKIKAIVDENFQDYKEISMFIATATCTWKCGKELCQNSPLALSPIIEVRDCEIVQRYLANPLTAAIVIGGLEPFDQAHELWDLINEFRRYTNDTIVIYTGYTEEEKVDVVKAFSAFPNIIVKFGRYVPNQPSHYDAVLGINLASDNQYARKIS